MTQTKSLNQSTRCFVPLKLSKHVSGHGTDDRVTFIIYGARVANINLHSGHGLVQNAKYPTLRDNNTQHVHVQTCTARVPDVAYSVRCLIAKQMHCSQLYVLVNLKMLLQKKLPYE